MHKRWDFFKEADSSFGVFYPTHYVVAGFDTLAHAEQAEQALSNAGFAADEVRAADGNFVVNQVESQKDASWLDDIKVQIARIIGTEANYIDEDLALARRGGAFLFAHARDHETMQRIGEALKRLHPIYARYYAPVGVVHLMQPAQASNAASV